MAFGSFLSRKTSSPRSHKSFKLGFDCLEDRLVMDVTLASITAPNILVGKDTLVPLSATDTLGLPLTYSVTSANSAIHANVITQGRTLVLDVTGGTGSSAFSGTLKLHLFENWAPATTARIIQLVNSGFYNGLTFHRVVQGFVAQGGDPNGDGTGGSGTKFDDEFNTHLTFNSFGLLAMANSGDDTNDSQFFITDTSPTASFPQNLNFNYNVFGQLVSGNATFQQIMSTPVDSNSKPTSPVTITHAYLINDDTDPVLDLSSTLTASGSGLVTVRVTNSRGQTTTQSFTATVAPDSVNGQPTENPPFLNQIIDRQTNTNIPINFDVSATDINNKPLTFVVRRAADFSQLDNTDNVSVTVTSTGNNTAHIVILPNQGFTGLVNLKIGVTDLTDLTNATVSNFDTQPFNLLVTDSPISPRTLSLVAGTGVLPGNVVNMDHPTVQFLAPADHTVNVFVNGTQVGTATQQSVFNGDGTYRFTIPSNKLVLGANTITAQTVDGANTSLASSALTVTFTPSLQQIYVVPGNPGDQTTLTFDMLAHMSPYADEVGLYQVDDLTGAVNGVAPSSANYRQTVLNSSTRQVIFSLQPGGPTGTRTFTFAAGTKLAFYLVQNHSAASATSATNVFFSLLGANRDGIFHTEAFNAQDGRSIFGWDDATRYAGDRDYNDLVFSIRNGTTNPAFGALAADIANPATTVNASFGLLPTLSSRFRPMAGEIGIFPILNASGAVRAPTANNPNATLNPSDAGYAQAALSQQGVQVLFTSGDTPSNVATRTLQMAGGSLYGIYYLPRGTAASFLTGNPGNAIAAGRINAYFSFAGANPDGGKVHMRSYPKQGDSRLGSTLRPILNDPARIQLMGTANGTNANFSDFILTYQQSIATGT
jgi:cyclophilin family peptidyl-prolyl cis-trans isomerase